jgi:hypothetical protein
MIGFIDNTTRNYRQLQLGRQDLSGEAEECPLLEAVARERLKAKQAGKRLADAVVICELWRLAVAL